jgi:hypothetical protein
MKIQSKKLAFWRRFIQSPLHAQYCQYRSTYLHRIGREFEDGEMFLVSQMLVCMYKSLISNLGCAAEFDKPPNLISRRTFLLLQPKPSRSLFLAEDSFHFHLFHNITTLQTTTTFIITSSRKKAKILASSHHYQEERDDDDDNDDTDTTASSKHDDDEQQQHKQHHDP